MKRETNGDRATEREGVRGREGERERERESEFPQKALPAIGAEINCCFDSDTEIGLMKQKYIYSKSI